MAGICQPKTLPGSTLPPPCHGDLLLFTLELPSGQEGHLQLLLWEGSPGPGWVSTPFLGGPVQQL